MFLAILFSAFLVGFGVMKIADKPCDILESGCTVVDTAKTVKKGQVYMKDMSIKSKRDPFRKPEYMFFQVIDIKNDYVKFKNTKNHVEGSMEIKYFLEDAFLVKDRT